MPAIEDTEETGAEKALIVGSYECVIFASHSLSRADSIPQTLHPTPLSLLLLGSCWATGASLLHPAKKGLLDQCIPQQSALRRFIMTNTWYFCARTLWGIHSAQDRGAVRSCLPSYKEQPLPSPSSHEHGSWFLRFSCLSFSLWFVSSQTAPGSGCLSPGPCFSFIISASEILTEVSIPAPISISWGIQHSEI